MTTIIPFLLIIGALAAIIVIIVKKYPQLTLLDADQLSDVKQEKKKHEYWKKKMANVLIETKAQRQRRIGPLVSRIKGIQTIFRQYVGRVERNVRRHAVQKEKNVLPEPGVKDKLRVLLQEAKSAFEQKNYDTAEKKYIAAARLDKKNIEAYRGWADVYYAVGQIPEARETYKFVLHLDPQNDAIWVKLGDLYTEDSQTQDAINCYQQAILINDNISTRFMILSELMSSAGQNDAALEAAKQAVELEPQNPKYLDNLIEISIMVGDKNQALVAFRALRMVNPENQKLDIFKEKINKM